MRKPISHAEEHIFSKIHFIRNYKVLLDADLAELYGVETRVLKQAVKRNLDRFPKDFMFELTSQEWENIQSTNLRSQIVTSSWGGTRYRPMAFTEQGIAMLSSVLKSKEAIAINIQIMRAFVRMRQLVSNYADLLKKIEKLEASDLDQNKHIRKIYDIIRELIEPPHRERRTIGFKPSHLKE